MIFLTSQSLPGFLAARVSRPLELEHTSLDVAPEIEVREEAPS